MTGGRSPGVSQAARAAFIFLTTGSAILNHEAGRQSLAEVLFPMLPVDGWAKEHEEVIDALKNAPRVLKIIGGEPSLALPYKSLVEILRCYIDPCKYDDFLWWATVWHAEQWLELEEIVSPGVRGKGKKTKVLVKQAIALAANSYTKAQIAFSLGVAPSTVSSWLRRYPEFGRVKVARQAAVVPVNDPLS